MGGRETSRQRDRDGRPIVCDASPLIALAKIGQTNLLREVFSTIIVPPAVVTETRPAVRPAWIVERSLTRPLPLRVVSEELGRGERETIGLALELDVEAGLDERRGRCVAQSLGIRVVGTVGVLLLAKEAGVISALRPHIDALLATEFYLSPWLIADALALANENG